MKYKKSVFTSILIVSVCLLIACQNKNNVDFSTERKMAEKQSVENIRESVRTTEYAIIPETIEETTVKESEMGIETTEETMEENESSDQAEYTWLDLALAECLEKKPGELTEEDYLSVTTLCIYGGKRIYRKVENGITVSTNDKSIFYPFADQVPTSIDIEAITMCRNLQYLDIELNFEKYSGVYVQHYEKLSQFHQMQALTILLNDLSSTNGVDLADSLADLNFICEMPDLEWLYLENISLPADLSPIFMHKIKAVRLPACGITEDSFRGMDETANWPDVFGLWRNQISDATVLTAAQKPDGSGIKQLSLAWNPLENIGDAITWEEMERENTWHDIRLSLGNTEFEEHSVYWNAD